MSAALGLLAMPIVGAAGVGAPIGAIVLAGARARTLDDLQSAHRRAVLADLRCSGARRCDPHAPNQTCTVSRHRSCARRYRRRLVCRERHGRRSRGRGAVRSRRLCAQQASCDADVVAGAAGRARRAWACGRHGTASASVAGGGRNGARACSCSISCACRSRTSYIGFRAGQLLQLSLPGLAALFFARSVASPTGDGALRQQRSRSC